METLKRNKLHAEIRTYAQTNSLITQIRYTPSNGTDYFDTYAVVCRSMSQAQTEELRESLNELESSLANNAILVQFVIHNSKSKERKNLGRKVYPWN